MSSRVVLLPHAPGLLADCEQLGNCLGLRLVWQMDGASYHKAVHPDHVPLHGPGGLYGFCARYKVSDDQKRGWKAERCKEWLKTGDDGHDAKLEELPLATLREIVEHQSEQVKCRVKGIAQKNSQELWFTPPHIGKYLSPIGP